MQTIQQTINGLNQAKDAHAAMFQAAQRLAQLEPTIITHTLTVDDSRRKYDAIARAVEALQGAL